MHRSDFVAQVAHATEVLRCRWYTFGDIMENYVLKGEKTPQNACVMTLDDAHLNNYENAFPVLQEYGVKATFYVAPGFIAANPDEARTYMSWHQLDEIYASGHEIGSHTYSSGSLIRAGWSYNDLVFQIKEAKATLEARGYYITTFAYPLGDWNEDILQLLVDVGHIAARDTIKDNTWRDRRPITVGYSEDLIWHMHYHKPELETPELLGANLRYTGWWQFEEDFKTIRDDDGDITIRSSLDPTSTSYAAVYPGDPGDSISNKFLVSEDGVYTVNILAKTGDASGGYYDYLNNMRVYIDGIAQELTPVGEWTCITVSNRHFCEFAVTAILTKGTHDLRIVSGGGEILLDKFSIFQTFSLTNAYDLTITEESAPARNINPDRQIALSLEASLTPTFDTTDNPHFLIPLLVVMAIGAGAYLLLKRQQTT